MRGVRQTVTACFPIKTRWGRRNSWLSRKQHNIAQADGSIQIYHINAGTALRIKKWPVTKYRGITCEYYDSPSCLDWDSNPSSHKEVASIVSWASLLGTEVLRNSKNGRVVWSRPWRKAELKIKQIYNTACVPKTMHDFRKRKFVIGLERFTYNFYHVIKWSKTTSNISSNVLVISTVQERNATHIVPRR
jgi:hypothetical protein